MCCLYAIYFGYLFISYGWAIFRDNPHPSPSKFIIVDTFILFWIDRPTCQPWMHIWPTEPYFWLKLQLLYALWLRRRTQKLGKSRTKLPRSMLKSKFSHINLGVSKLGAYSGKRRYFYLFFIDMEMREWTYDASIDDCPKFGVQFFLVQVGEVHSGLVRQKYFILTHDHQTGSTKEKCANKRKDSAKCAATRFSHFLPL